MLLGRVAGAGGGDGGVALGWGADLGEQIAGVGDDLVGQAAGAEDRAGAMALFAQAAVELAAGEGVEAVEQGGDGDDDLRARGLTQVVEDDVPRARVAGAQDDLDEGEPVVLPCVELGQEPGARELGREQAGDVGEAAQASPALVEVGVGEA